jgi:CO/xanthine dehydrogenase FAD-binding subunit
MTMKTIQNYKKAESLEEAWELNQKRGNRVLGGMLWLKMGSGNIQTAIDLSGLELNKIEETEEEFAIGCMVSLRQLETHPGLAAYTGGAMREAVRHIVGVQFRNLATVGGSIFGRYGFSDVLTMFLAMDSFVELYKGGIVPMKEFAAMKYDRDILVRIHVKKTPMKLCYQSVRNSQTDFPVLTCAASFPEKKEGESGELPKFRIAVGARPSRAVMLEDEEQILTLPVTKEKAEAFGEYAAAHIATDSNMRGSAAYRTHLVKVLAARAAMRAGGISEC